MKKIDYGKLDWSAQTNWGFCGSERNLREVQDRYWKLLGVRVSTEEFGYRRPIHALAYEAGDIVTYRGTGSAHSGRFAVVTSVSAVNGLGITFPNGDLKWVQVHSVSRELAPADIPEELVALARAEAGKPVDLSKCPLKRQGACMEA